MIDVMVNVCDIIIKTCPILTNLELAVTQKSYCTQQAVIDVMDHI